MPLCLHCLGACSFDVPDGAPTTKECIEHHAGLAALRLSAASCALCGMILSQIETHAFDKERFQGDEFWSLKMERETTSSGYALLRPLVWTQSPDSVASPPSLVVIRNNFEYMPYLERPIWKNEALENRLSTAKAWLQTCIAGHGDGACRVSLTGARPTLPARVLDLGPPGHDTWPKVFETSGIMSDYATLSYCWGQASKFVACRSNISSLHQGINPLLLPRTFQDAILTVRALGLRYLWIDALCILQDDSSDVQRQVANMASIYRKALVTIAVDAASSVDQGFFSTVSQTLSVDLEAGSSCTVDEIGSVRIRPRPRYQQTVLQSPLRTRGWTLQEDLLSMRTLHCAGDQMYWQCGQHITSEDGIIDLSPYDSWKCPANLPAELALGDHYGNSIRVTSRNPNAYQRFWNLPTWYLMVADYSARSLTYPSDKLAAIAGLTKVFEQWNGTASVAGLWLADLHFGLAWRGDASSSTRSRRTTASMPSWSWVSFDGPVRYLDTRVFQDSREQTSREFQLLGSHIEWSGQPLSSTITRATLSLGAKIRQLPVQIDDVEHQMIVITRNRTLHYDAKNSDSSTPFQIISSLERPSVKICAVAELDQPIPPGARTFFALLLHSPVSWKRTDMPTTSAFLLVESTGTKREYRRVGIGEAATELFLFEDVGWQNVVLV
ncbi:heterokaryon incompatibility protein-domain-containing protein [Phyllosticta citribraziliensis]|uniref:Heterokaryon incompatibility protein-domain-containing protein n=1 Tax=Phyllosticta citribraziliensis TaxID=989973 RepID=A0ABR1LM04_9PEZI